MSRSTANALTWTLSVRRFPVPRDTLEARVYFFEHKMETLFDAVHKRWNPVIWGGTVVFSILTSAYGAPGLKECAGLIRILVSCDMRELCAFLPAAKSLFRTFTHEHDHWASWKSVRKECTFDWKHDRLFFDWNRVRLDWDKMGQNILRECV